jgi:hypothetical protein
LIVAAAVLGIAAGPAAFAQGAQGDAGKAPAAPPPDAAGPAAVAPDPPAQRNILYIRQDVPYLDTKTIDRTILAECQLPEQGAELLEKAARRAGFNVVRNDDAVKSGKGRVLEVEITGAVSRGNPFTGHRKQVNVRGRLIEDGKEIGDFSGYRHSMGGAFAGFKGSCAVLGRCLDALTGDIAHWLRNPGKGSRVGD